MNLFQNEEMRELVVEFCKESLQLMDDLEKVLQNVEANPDHYQRMEEFGQIIDRIMGASKTIGISEISDFCELGKAIGYKCGQNNYRPLLALTIAVLYDTIFLIRKMLEQLQTGNSNVLKGIDTKAFGSRLKWLSEKFKHIDRSSCASAGDQSSAMSQNEIDNLIKDLNL